MRKKLLKLFICFAVPAMLMISKNAITQTAGTLSFNVTTLFTNGQWGTESDFVVWIENSSGAFVKTRVLNGNDLDHLQQWASRTPSHNTVDAIVGATQTADPFTLPVILWSGNDITGTLPFNLLPDGNYTVGMELAWRQVYNLGTGRQIFSVTFTKGSSPQTVSPADQTNFTTMTLQWTPAAQIAVTTSALSSVSYCAGTNVSVPFTKGSGTVYNNNVWTAQLSDASGSFSNPVTIGTLNGTSAGTISATIPAGTVPGTGYRIRVVGSQPSCTGSDNGSDIIIPVTPPAPEAGTITPPTCTEALGSIELTGLPSGGAWTLTRNPGGINTGGSGSTATISGLASGTYSFTVTNASSCTSAPSANIVIDPQPPTPAISDQSTSIMTGGTFTITPSGAGVPSGTTYTWDTPTYTGGVNGGSAQSTPQSNISGTLYVANGEGTAVYMVTPVTGLCTGSAFTVTVDVTSSCTPVAMISQPTGNTICGPSANATFTVGLSGTSPFAYHWQYNNGSVWVNLTDSFPAGALYSDTNTATLNVTGITLPGSYQYRCFITNCFGNNNVTSDAVTLIVNETPSAPLIGSITQPACKVATGSVVLNGLPATGNWTLTQIPGTTVTGSGESLILSGIVSGTYNYTVTNSFSCASLPSTAVVINPQPETPPTPTITYDGVFLHSSDTSGNQWYNQYGLIYYATHQDYKPVFNGDHFVIVTKNGCKSEFSNEINITNAGIDSYINNKKINVYPNPVSDELIIEITGNTEKIDFELLNSFGQTVLKGNMLEKSVIPASGFAPGFYLIKLDNGKTYELKKVIKE